jgi:hypothetical protein
MRIRIQVAAEDTAKAWSIMVRHSPGEAHRDSIFVLSEEAVETLRKAGINFKELSREPGTIGSQGVIAGERV